ncbi:hypothetical protein K432DRAFT_385719 [Lepidopterella palustris CBS 459.81]|uniref:Uncharacterized protein n=1 Tax=Lepidopterella palustris CBS 459.81 TaxID=1314670 RepID=A0A8E2E2P1_9PEZI|nr:hypothetical protein K432DRAFT_385719 [Lepidopterella palustris CBS 459.81]
MAIEFVYRMTVKHRSSTQKPTVLPREEKSFPHSPKFTHIPTQTSQDPERPQR